MNHLQINTFATRNNWEKFIDYPEHKNKRRELIVYEELVNNYTFVNKKLEFSKEIKQWEQDQHDLNFKRTHHKNRTLILEKFNEKLNKKKIMTTYTITENVLFFKQKFNNEISKINEYYEHLLDCFTEEANIPKEKILSAIVHHDQTAPHLHIAISNFDKKFSKDLNREVKTVNINQHNLYNNIKHNLSFDNYTKWLKLRQIKMSFMNSKIKEGDFNAYIKDNYDVGLLMQVQSRLNKKYQEKYNIKLYSFEEDYIYMDKIRGFTNNDILKILELRNQAPDYKIMERNVILSYRKTKLENSLKSFKYQKSVNQAIIQKTIDNLFQSQKNKDIELERFYFNKLLELRFNKQYNSYIKKFYSPDFENEFNKLKEFKTKYCNQSISQDNKFNFYYFNQTKNKLDIGIYLIDDLATIKVINNHLDKYLEILDVVLDKEIKSPVYIKEDVLNPNLARLIAMENLIKELNPEEPTIIPELVNFVNNQIILSRKVSFGLDGYEKTITKEKEVNFDLIKNRREFLNEIRKLNNLSIYQTMKKERNYFFKTDLDYKEYKHKLDMGIIKNQLKQDFILKLKPDENRIMFQRVLRQRIDYDLKCLNLMNSKDKNNFKDNLNIIERNREYNKILQYCAFRQKNLEETRKRSLEEFNQLSKDYLNLDINQKQELTQKSKNLAKNLTKDIKYTPQTLAKELFNNEFRPLNFQEFMKNQEHNLNIKKEEQVIEEFKFVKNIEISILHKEEKNLAIELENHLKMSEAEELNYYQLSIQKFQEQVIEQGKDLAIEARQINNWFTSRDLELDLKQKELKIDDLHFEEIEKTIEKELKVELKNNSFYQDLIQTEILNALELENNKLENDFLGIDLELVNEISKDYLINEKQLKIEDNQSLEQKLEPNLSLNKERETKLEQEQTFDYSPMFAIEEPAWNMTDLNDDAAIFLEKRNRINTLIALQKKGRNIDDLCNSWNINPKLINLTIKKAKELKMEGQELDVYEMKISRR